MREPLYLTPLLTQVYIERQRRAQEMIHYDPNISKNDLGVNVVVLGILVTFILYLLITDGGVP